MKRNMGVTMNKQPGEVGFVDEMIERDHQMTVEEWHEEEYYRGLL